MYLDGKGIESETSGGRVFLMVSMSKDELITFLKKGTFTAKLATVNKDRSPHVVPLWFVLDNEGNIIFETETR